MKLRHSLWLICLEGLLACHTLPSDETPTHMLRLQCAGDDAGRFISRLAVIEATDGRQDYGLATGHAIPANRPCWVQDFSGGRSDVSRIDMAPNYVAGSLTDWAVIRFDRMPTQNLVRYDLGVLPETEIETTTVSFAQARGLRQNLQTCRLSRLNFATGTQHVAHDCRAVAGQSGSPITRQVDGVDELIGLHIGHLWMIESPLTGRPDRKGYINLLDADTIAQIEAIIAQPG